MEVGGGGLEESLIALTSDDTREPKGRGDVWTEEREARNERPSDEGRHRLQEAPEASGINRERVG
jgi:hypothetical protein